MKQRVGPHALSAFDTSTDAARRVLASPIRSATASEGWCAWRAQVRACWVLLTSQCTHDSTCLPGLPLAYGPIFGNGIHRHWQTATEVEDSLFTWLYVCPSIWPHYAVVSETKQRHASFPFALVGRKHTCLYSRKAEISSCISQRRWKGGTRLPLIPYVPKVDLRVDGRLAIYH